MCISWDSKTLFVFTQIQAIRTRMAVIAAASAQHQENTKVSMK